MNRREFLTKCAGVAGGFALSNCALAAGGTVLSNETLAVRMGTSRPNILLITADDMNFDSLGATGCKLPGISPNLDRLAREGLRFEHAHIMTAICGPSRGAFHTGRYPHCTGSMGHGEQPPEDWQPRQQIPSISTYLHEGGYLTGLMCKGAGRAIEHTFDLDLSIYDLDRGRNPQTFYTHCLEFFKKAKASNQPFFLNANSCDPHKPWARSQGEPDWLEKQRQKAQEQGYDINYPDPKTDYSPEDIPIPAFLPDTPEVREHIAPYYDSVNRMDESVGAILRALKDSGAEDNTLIVFLSDHGMGCSFAKRSCYYYSTKTPLIIKWQGKIKPGRVNTEHVVSSIDLVPTFIEAAGLPALDGLDGRSLMPMLTGGRPKNWRQSIYTCFNYMNYPQYYPARAMVGKKYLYVWNAWAGGNLEATDVIHGTGNGLQETCLIEPAKTRWGDDYEYGIPEEFYDIENDPGYWNNLIDNPSYQDAINTARNALLEVMTTSLDPELDRLKNEIIGK